MCEREGDILQYTYPCPAVPQGRGEAVVRWCELQPRIHVMSTGELLGKAGMEDHLLGMDI